MGLRCTVFGHRWGDPDTEREREEDGNEVVATVREVRTCRCCGTEEVLGTSTEVTAIPETTEATGATDTPDGASAARDAAPGDDEESYDPATDDGVILDDDGDAGGDRRPREWPDRPERDDVEEAGAPAPWPETARETDDEPREERFVGADQRSEDGVVRADDGTRPTRDDADQSPAGEAGSNTDGGGEIIEAGDEEDDDLAGTQRTLQGGLDEPRDSSTGAPTDHPADAADESDEPTSGDEPPAGDDSTDDDHPAETGDDASMMGPDATRHPDDDAEVLESTEPNEQSRETAREPVDPTDVAGDEASPPETAPSLDPSEPPSNDEPAPEDVEFYCPECGYVDDSRWPSRRAGDVCPDCQRSYLSERRT